MNTYASIIDSVGRTPLVCLDRLNPSLFAKHEARNPVHSVKDRIAASMIRDAEASNALRPGMTIVEPTSGNTGIALAAFAAARGYKIILTMPETMSIERRKVLTSLGAELVLTPGAEGMTGAIKQAQQLREAHPDKFFMPQQFNNPANPHAHYKTTGPEIWEDMGGQIDALVAGVGTGGTISGAGRYLRERHPAIELIAVEPTESPVITQHLAGKPLMPAPHKIQGIGAGFIPATLTLDIISRVITIDSATALQTAKQLATTEGLFVGISSGAAVAAALQVAQEKGPESRIAVILPDAGDRYLSMF